jgi:hypothetical protein
VLLAHLYLLYIRQKSSDGNGFAAAHLSVVNNHITGIHQKSFCGNGFGGNVNLHSALYSSFA